MPRTNQWWETGSGIRNWNGQPQYQHIHSGYPIESDPTREQTEDLTREKGDEMMSDLPNKNKTVTSLYSNNCTGRNMNETKIRKSVDKGTCWCFYIVLIKSQDYQCKHIERNEQGNPWKLQIIAKHVCTGTSIVIHLPNVKHMNIGMY